MTRASLIVFLFCALFTPLVTAHSRGETWSSVTVRQDGTASVSYAIAASDLATLLPDMAYDPDLANTLPSYIASHYHLRRGGAACSPEHATLRQTDSLVEVRFDASCKQDGNLIIENDALFDRLPNHIHIARLNDANNRVFEKLFTNQDRRFSIEAPRTVGTVLAQYLALGIEHILTGYDHLAFLLAVILLSRRTATLILMITGFTIGHSVTLALAVLGYASARSGAVEALIGFTIALVAAEVVAVRHRLDNGLLAATAFTLILMMLLASVFGLLVSGPNITTLAGILVFSICYLLLTRDEKLQGILNPLLTMLFGMIHGFGFAGLLIEIGLPTDKLVPALVGFNVGVEVGQLAVFGVVLATGVLLRRLATRWFTPEGVAVDALASVLCGVGLYWFISRSV